MKILLIEDEPSIVAQFMSAKKLFERRSKKSIEIKEYGSLASLGDTDISVYNFAVVDLNLDGSHDLESDSGGTEFIAKVQEKLNRIPIVIHSAHASPDHLNGLVVKSITKGDKPPIDILNYLDSILATGLNNILGGAGNIEQWLSEVVENVINPNLDSWIENAASNPTSVEDSLLRHVLNHLIYKGQTDTRFVTPEEFYLLNVKELKTGLLMSDEKGHEFIVINPSCDLSNNKAPMIYLLPIEPYEDICNNEYVEGQLANKNRENLETVMKNSHKTSHSGHWLPKTKLIKGGRICFKSLLSIDFKLLTDRFESLDISVADSYISNIQDRFTSYLSRVGQPDICYKKEVKEIVTAIRDKQEGNDQ